MLVTAGASAPEYLVQEIVHELSDRHGGEVEESHIIEENMQFELPLSLRVLKRHQAAQA